MKYTYNEERIVALFSDGKRNMNLIKRYWRILMKKDVCLFCWRIYKLQYNVLQTLEHVYQRIAPEKESVLCHLIWYQARAAIIFSYQRYLKNKVLILVTLSPTKLLNACSFKHRPMYNVVTDFFIKTNKQFGSLAYLT